MTLTKIVSGGQTGVDRGALDAALELGFPCGGWCPPGREAEDGRIGDGYPLVELVRGGYRERTVQNVIDSDATLILHFGELEGGTEQTMLHCIRRGRPYKLIDASEVTPTRAAETAKKFVEAGQVSVLNVAGPRASRQAMAHRYAFETIMELLLLARAPSSCAPTGTAGKRPETMDEPLCMTTLLREAGLSESGRENLRRYLNSRIGPDKTG